ncbi:MAG: VanW family protein [Bacteroidota bacterium]
MMINLVKLFIKIHSKKLDDLLHGNHKRFSILNTNFNDFKYELVVEQEIMPSPTFESKVFNLATASNLISKHLILPGQIFSFWKIVGNPNKIFKKGRTIQNGKIKEDVGGGICQVSGVVYYLCLISGLEVTERYNHSVDLYNDETRFAPLGTDATVVYGYKDLRFKNNLNTPIKIDIIVEGNKITGRLLSQKKLVVNELNYEIQDLGEKLHVIVLDKFGTKINSSSYLKLVEG